MKLSQIKPNPANPRIIKDEAFQKLCKSIQEFPKMMELRPIVTDAFGMVLGGNMRLKALQHLGMKDIPDSWVRKASELTAGDVDSLSYLKCVLRQQNLEYCLFSTWCMAADDIMQFDEWLTAGKIKKLDAYVGEIFPGTYKMEYKKLKQVFDKHQCGRIAVFKNHSKIYAGYGDKFYFGIETSANINTNPRTENGCITLWRYEQAALQDCSKFVNRCWRLVYTDLLAAVNFIK